MSQQKSKAHKNGNDHTAQRAARLLAVQSVYRAQMNEQPLLSAVQDCLDRPFIMNEQEEIFEMKPDKPLCASIIRSLHARQQEINDIVLESVLSKSKGNQDDSARVKSLQNDVILFSILLCGATEILAHEDIDAPIIVNDYLEITHAFYDTSESKLVNGVLDAITRKIRA